MPTISQLSTTDTLSGSDTLVVMSRSSGDVRKATIDNVLALIPTATDIIANQQDYAPTTTGFYYTLDETTEDTILRLLLTTTLASGTIQLPMFPKDQQKVIVFCSRLINVFNIATVGASVIGAPTTLIADSNFTLTYLLNSLTWYRTV